MIIVNGVTLPEEETLKITKEKIWSSNAGRLDNGYFAGDIVAVKHTLEVTWKRLKQDETAIVNKCLNGNDEYYNVFYTDYDGTGALDTFYFGTPSYQYTIINDNVYCDITVNMIER